MSAQTVPGSRRAHGDARRLLPWSLALLAACSFEPAPVSTRAAGAEHPDGGDEQREPERGPAARDAGGDDDAGDAPASRCEAGALRCDASRDGVEVCANGTRWMDAERCAGVCRDAACTGRCRPGSRRCRSNQAVEQCSADGEWTAAAACPAACIGAGACEGECRPGIKRCASDGRRPETCNAQGVWVAAAADCERGCENGVCMGCLASAETCDGDDNDCNGIVDDRLTRACTSACGSGTATCSAGRFQDCSAPQPTAERCDAVDNDCDGQVDEALQRPCSSACGQGVEACAAGRFQRCTAPRPAAEVCNQRDDDCDMRVDEGFLTETSMTTYTAVKVHQAMCDGVQERVGPNCNAAIERFCAAQGCGRHGFGPLENTQDTLVVACVTQVTTFDVAYSALEAEHPQCTQAEKYGRACNAAIHRLCRSRGFQSGFGPLAMGAASATVACVPAAFATVVDTSYSELHARHEGCDGSAERMGRACNAAIHRLCIERGATTGFGPVENTGDQAVVVCLGS